MQTSTFIQFLLDNGISVFTLDDAMRILNKPRGYTRLFLHRCAKKKAIARVERGVYYLPDRANEYEIASHIVYPSYVSMVSALSYYGLTTQIPNIIYVISTKRHKTIRNMLGFDIVFRQIKLEMMFGYHKESNGNIFIADPEKAIVDIYYFKDVSDLDTSMIEKPARIDLDKLELYAKRSGSRSVIRGVSDLLKGRNLASRATRLHKFPIGDFKKQVF